MHRTTALRRAGRELARACLDILCPLHCPGCGGAAGGLCRACAVHLQRRGPPLCPRCGEPRGPLGDGPCGGRHAALRGIAWARAPFAYAGTGGALVRRLKFVDDRGAAALLARAMVRAVEDELRGPWRRALLVPVPLHRRRRRLRGVDQAALLAAAVGSRLSVAAPVGVLARVRATMPQGDPRVTSRAANVAGAFAVRRPRAVADRRVVLVDDVTTSGSTARECAGRLRAAGAIAVALLTAARA